MTNAAHPKAFLVRRTLAMCMIVAWVSAYAAGSHALTINQFRTNNESGTGEILEPSKSQPQHPPQVSTEEPEASTIISDDFSDPLTGNVTIDGQANEISSELAFNLTGVAEKSELTGPLTSLEWIEQWSISGEWLENDQWADFKAIAIAGYLPDIRYWLGGDRWASFGSTPLSTGANRTPSAKDGSPATGKPQDTTATTYTRLPSAYDHSKSGGGSGGKTSTSSETAKPVTTTEFLLWVLKKVMREPIFYVIALCGIGLLLWSFRKQSIA